MTDHHTTTAQDGTAVRSSCSCGWQGPAREGWNADADAKAHAEAARLPMGSPLRQGGVL